MTREEDLFAEAIAITDPRDRLRFLDVVCQGNSTLRNGLDALIQAHDDENPLDRDLGLTWENHHPLMESATIPSGLLAGRYRLGPRLGEGGMGTVFEAEQLTPVRRNVAVKLIRHGVDNVRVLARFEAERQALAVLDHPGITRVFDAGTTDDGRPFFVMEFVRGEPLTAYCDRHLLTIRERLGLVVQVTKAVQHAHQKGILHRDLKPSNILVAASDGQTTVKVIDFGLAKALTGGVLPEVSQGGHSTIGTPLYMAPEQAESLSDIDTRADVYAIGVILYELLTGSTPILEVTLRNAAYHEMLRLIRDVDPPTPVARLSGDTALDRLAQVRQIQPDQLKRTVRGDLEWVTMKCLEKDRDRRYESASAITAELERFLADEPVLAAPPNRWYRVGKFAHRHKPAVVGASLAAVGLVVGFITATVGFFQARSANLRTQARLVQLDKSNDILTDVFSHFDIRRIRRGNTPIEAVLAERLVAAHRQLDGDDLGDDLATAAMRVKIGRALESLGFYSDAIAVLAVAVATYDDRLGAEHEQTVDARMELAIALKSATREAESLALVEGIVRIRNAAHGPTHSLTLDSRRLEGELRLMLGQTRQARTIIQEVYDARHAEDVQDERELIRVTNDLGNYYKAIGEPRQAVPYGQEVVDRSRRFFGDEHPETYVALDNLSSLYAEFGDADAATPLIEEAYRGRRKVLGNDHPDTISSLEHYAVNLMMKKEFLKALPLCEQCWTFNKAKLGPTHANTLTSLANYGACFDELHQYDKALPLKREAANRFEEKYGRRHGETLLTKFQLGVTLFKLNQSAEAAVLFREVWEARSVNATMFTPSGRWLVGCFAKLKNANECAKAGTDYLAVIRLKHPPESLALADAIEQIVNFLLTAEAYANADELLKEPLAIRTKLKDSSIGLRLTRAMHARARAGLADPMAAALLRAAFDDLVAVETEIPENRRSEVVRLLESLIALSKLANRPDDVKRWTAEHTKRMSPGK
jgi:serine/threonine protein kinase